MSDTKTHLSPSQYRRWRECPARERSRQAGEYPDEFARYEGDTEATLVGRYVETALCGGDEAARKWIAEHPDSTNNKGVKYAAFLKADEMVARARQDDIWQRLLPVSQFQVSVEGTIDGEDWRGTVDVLAPEAGLFVDLKTAADVSDVWDRDARRYLPWYQSKGYWEQIAVYRYLLAQAGHGWLDGYIGALTVPTPKMPPRILWIWFDGEDCDAVVETIAVGQREVLRVKRGEVPATPCGACWWCALHCPVQVTRARLVTAPTM